MRKFTILFKVCHELSPCHRVNRYLRNITFLTQYLLVDRILAVSQIFQFEELFSFQDSGNSIDLFLSFLPVSKTFLLLLNHHIYYLMKNFQETHHLLKRPKIYNLLYFSNTQQEYISAGVLTKVLALLPKILR